MVEFRKIKGTPRKEALGMDQLIPLYIRALKLSAGLNTQRVFAAWDAVSGVAGQTLHLVLHDQEPSGVPEAVLDPGHEPFLGEG